MNHNKVCALEDFAEPELVAAMREACPHKVGTAPHFPVGVEHRKDWEVAMAVRSLRRFDGLGPDAVVLGVAAGTEDTLFHLTAHARQVFATDRYLGAGNWEPTSPIAMLVEPGVAAPYEFDVSRLVVQHMDARWLRYPDDTFDGVFSSGSIEHVGELADVANVASEMGRVLKPGGVLSLSTEFRISGPPGGVGWPGLTLLFSVENLQRYIVEASGLELVDELDTGVSDTTMATRRELSWTITDHEARVAQAPDQASAHLAWSFPHVVLGHGDYVFTSVHLALRKTERYPVVPNAWAAPSAATRAAISAANLALLSAGPDGRPDDAAAAGDGLAPPPEAAPPPQPARRPSIEREVAVRGARSREVDAVLADLDTTRAAVGGALAGAALRLAGATAAGDRHSQVWRSAGAWASPTAPLAAPEDERARWVPVRVTLPGGLGFDIVLDPAADDPIGATLAGGRVHAELLVGLMLELVRPGELVVDLGAHLGQFSLAAAAAGCRVLAVEASPANAVLLRASAARNAFAHLRVVHAAVSDAPGSVSFLPHGPWGHVGAAHDQGSVEVPAVMVDDLLSELGWGTPTFVKIDVEGSELRALRGMSATLHRPDAPAVLFESNGHTLAFSGLRPKDLLTELETAGYVNHAVEATRLVATRSHEFQPQTIVDYLAVKEPSVHLSRPVEPLLSFAERVARIVADCCFPNPDHRAYIAAALADADAALLSNPAVGQALDALTHDPVSDVRAASSWWVVRRQGSLVTPEAP